MSYSAKRARETKTPEHVKFRLVPKPTPPTESWWICEDKLFAQRQRIAQQRMSGGEVVFAKANGEDES